MKKYLLLLILFSFQLQGQDLITISEARDTDQEGVLLRLGDVVMLQGVVISDNIRAGGLQFSIQDPNSVDGIGVFSLNDPLDYTVTRGDMIEITGELSQFNGLGQIEPTLITVMSAGNALPAATAVTSLDEFSESSLIVFEDAMIVDPAQWTNSGSGFNVEVIWITCSNRQL